MIVIGPTPPGTVARRARAGRVRVRVSGLGEVQHHVFSELHAGVVAEDKFFLKAE